MEPYRPRRGRPNYLLWFAVIALAVCVGSLAATCIKFYVAAEGMGLYVQGTNRGVREHAVQIKRQSEAHEAKLRNERAQTPQGRQLAANCLDQQ